MTAWKHDGSPPQPAPRSGGQDDRQLQDKAPPSADFYDCCDNEQLTHETPEEAVEEWVESWLEPACDVTAVIAEHAPVALRSFRRVVRSVRWTTRAAEVLLEHAAEMFGEEFGDPGGADDGLDDAAAKDALPAMVAALERYYGHGRAWPCEEVGELILDAAVIEEMMRKYNPYWWDK